MKSTILIVLGLTSALGVAAQKSDTVIFNHPKSVVIVENDSILHLDVIGESGVSSYSYSKKVSSNSSTETIEEKDWSLGFLYGIHRKEKSKARSKVRSKVGYSGASFSLGLVSAVSASSDINVDMSKSIEIASEPFLSTTYFLGAGWHHGLTIGFGFGWKNFRMTGTNRFYMNGEQLLVGPYPTEATSTKFSRIKIFSWRIPLEYEYRSRLFGFGIGPVVNFNTYGSIKTRYYTNAGKQKDLTKHINQVPVTVDLKARIDVKGLMGFYVKYSPCHVIKSDFGPSFNSWTFGIELSDFPSF